ncbi:Outer membrane protein W [Microbulbifer marinus]|uniref:Outer membrane protein W n=2 Tax=Microbulbifer marinus TaxID=658218 RepID=A0A1H3VKZ5_9GAMM|nr:Outer membrane protein W [Microbulbifer marinus]
MKMTRILAPMALAVSSAVVSVAASAGPSGYAPPPPAATPAVYEAGTVMLRLGASWVDPDDDSGRWRYNRDLFPEFEGLGYRIDDDTGWNFSVGFMPIDHFSIELGYIGTTEHDVDWTGLLQPVLPAIGPEFEPLDGRLRVGSVDRQTGTLFLNWFPVCKESWIQPYVGLGAIYTDFDNLRFRTTANDYLSDLNEVITGPATMYFEDDWGWGAQFGVDIMFGRDSNWLVNLAGQYHDVDTVTDLHYAFPRELEPGTFVRAARRQLDLDAWVWNLGIGYKF